MSVPRIVPGSEARYQLKVSNSRFIATIGPAFSIEEAGDFIAERRREFSDASHNVPAFIIGHSPSVTAHSSDDGEPSGTAGRPALAVLKGSGLGDVVVVVTRYFGGTKLGTGGLVRAYSKAVRGAISAVPKAEKAATHQVEIDVPYSLLERVQLLAAESSGVILEREFAAEVKVSVQLRTDDFQAFNDSLLELSNGSIQAQITATDIETIMPLEEHQPPFR